MMPAQAVLILRVSTQNQLSHLIAVKTMKNIFTKISTIAATTAALAVAIAVEAPKPAQAKTFS
jgi:hypothetical protein